MKALELLTVITKYQNRQVVVNWYDEDDFLFERDGFSFEEIKSQTDSLIFFRFNKKCFSIFLDESLTFSNSSDFANHYILHKGTKRVEIYFP